MSRPQTYANHRRTDPAFHYFLLPVFLVNLGYRLAGLAEHPSAPATIELLVAAALVQLALSLRSYSLRNQDRLIRMEERLRIRGLASPEMAASLDALTIRQLVALRFAPDLEVVPLAERAIREELTPAQIKQAIVDWRPDTIRV